MTKRIASVVVALAAAGTFASAAPAQAVPNCTDRPIEDCVKEWIKVDVVVPCIPSGDLEDPC